MRILDIIPGTTVDGPGLRTSIYFAGCHHRCPGCHNPQSWDPLGGREMSVEDVVAIIEENGFNVTFSGGDPVYQAASIAPLAAELKARGYNIWMFTGFNYEEIAADAAVEPLLRHIDVIVDGPYIASLRDLSLRFRGSSNQRIIDIKRSTPSFPTLLHLDTTPDF